MYRDKRPESRKSRFNCVTSNTIRFGGSAVRSQFGEDPTPDPSLPPEAQGYVVQINDALRVWRETGARFNNDPPVDPDLTPEGKAAVDRIIEALRIWRTTGDPGPARQFGAGLPDRRRFYDNPFRDPNMPAEQQEYLDKRNAALRHYYQTGDPGPAAEFGFTLRDRREPNDEAKPEGGQTDDFNQ